MLAPDFRDRLVQQLERARTRGMLGPGPVEAHLDHAAAMAVAVDRNFRGRFLDLGSGAGVPGLALLGLWPAASGVLLDARRRRCSFLEEALQALGVADRAAVACGRAEELARDNRFRGIFDLVVARAFGGPATTAECAVGFLRPEGHLAVTEPPEAGRLQRWPADGLDRLGLSVPELRGGDRPVVAVMTATGKASDRWPRRVGVPGRRPLW